MIAALVFIGSVAILMVAIVVLLVAQQMYQAAIAAAPEDEETSDVDEELCPLALAHHAGSTLAN